MEEKPEKEESLTLVVWGFKLRYSGNKAEKRLKKYLKEQQMDAKVGLLRLSEFSSCGKFQLSCVITGRLERSKVVGEMSMVVGKQEVPEEAVKEMYAQIWENKKAEVQREVDRLEKEIQKEKDKIEELRIKDSIAVFGHPNASREEIKNTMQTMIKELQEARSKAEESRQKLIDTMEFLNSEE